MPFPFAAVAAGLGAFGSLFSNPAKQQADAQMALQRAAWQRQDQQRPFSSALMINPVMQQRQQLGQQNNSFNWGALQNRMTPQMLALLQAVSPQFAVPQQPSVGGGNGGGGGLRGAPGFTLPPGRFGRRFQ
jgi:hypothetical protein